MNNPMTLYLLIAGLSAFRFLETWNDKPFFLKKNPLRIFSEEVVFLTGIFAAGAVYFAAMNYFPEFADILFFLIFPALYFAFRAKNLPDSFAGGAFAFLCLFVFPLDVLAPAEAVKNAAELAAGIMVFRFALEGFRFRLLFSNVPRPFKGFALFLISAGLVSMALSAFFTGLR